MPADVAIAPAESDADLEALIEVRRRTAPDLVSTVENLRFQLESKPKFAYLVARVEDEPSPCGYVEKLDRRSRSAT